MHASSAPPSLEVIGHCAGTSFVLRFDDGRGVTHTTVLHERRDCRCGCKGGWDAWGARMYLHNTVELVRTGLWRPAPTVSTARRRRRRTSTFERFAQLWLRAKRDGVLGPSSGIADSTAAGYQWALGHLLPFFGQLPLSEITRERCLEFKALQLRRARELRAALNAGADLRDRCGRRARPLAPSSIKKLIDLLGAVLDEAVHEGYLPSNPARGRRMRITVRRPARSALEIDELAALLDAAAALDREARSALERPRDIGLTTRLVELHLRRGRRPSQIAADLRLARSTVSWHLRRLGAAPGQGFVARRVVCELLGRAGLRSSELCGLRIGDLWLDARAGAHLRIRESKTDAGVREVQLSPALVDVIRDHLERLRAAGLPDGTDAFLVPSSKGTRLDTRRVRLFVAAAWERASEVRAAEGLPPLPAITPHALRRTYVSFALVANRFDVKWVMGQVGHVDSRMTLDVYAQLMRRARREHGASFDRLVREARADAALLVDSSAHAGRRKAKWSGETSSTPWV